MKRSHLIHAVLVALCVASVPTMLLAAARLSFDFFYGPGDVSLYALDLPPAMAFTARNFGMIALATFACAGVALVIAAAQFVREWSRELAAAGAERPSP